MIDKNNSKDFLMFIHLKGKFESFKYCTASLIPYMLEDKIE